MRIDRLGCRQLPRVPLSRRSADVKRPEKAAPPPTPHRCISPLTPTSRPFPGKTPEPSVGLEPTTPSLPWKGEGVTSAHGRPRSGTKALQITLKWSVRLWWAKCGRSGTAGRKMDGTPVCKCVADYQGRPFSGPVSRRRGLGSAPCHLSRATPLGRVPTMFSSGDHHAPRLGQHLGSRRSRVGRSASRRYMNGSTRKRLDLPPPRRDVG